MPAEFGTCQKCGKEVDDITEVGYLGPEDRDDERCDQFMEFITVCKDCEGDDEG